MLHWRSAAPILTAGTETRQIERNLMGGLSLGGQRLRIRCQAANQYENSTNGPIPARPVNGFSVVRQRSPEDSGRARDRKGTSWSIGWHALRYEGRGGPPRARPSQAQGCATLSRICPTFSLRLLSAVIEVRISAFCRHGTPAQDTVTRRAVPLAEVWHLVFEWVRIIAEDAGLLVRAMATRSWPPRSMARDHAHRVRGTAL